MANNAKASSGEPHEHGPNCGCIAIRHNGHIDYLNGGHLHHPNGDEVSEHVIEVTERNPDHCTNGRGTKSDQEHVHGSDCEHEAVPHGDHIDYLVDGRLEHQHGNHCDDHGPVEVV